MSNSNLRPHLTSELSTYLTTIFDVSNASGVVSALLIIACYSLGETVPQEEIERLIKRTDIPDRLKAHLTAIEELQNRKNDQHLTSLQASGLSPAMNVALQRMLEAVHALAQPTQWRELPMQRMPNEEDDLAYANTAESPVIEDDLAYANTAESPVIEDDLAYANTAESPVIENDEQPKKKRRLGKVLQA